jgi:hypothetical protein
MIAAPTVSPPSGTYALSLSEPTNVQSGCLTNGGLSQAWDCDLVGSPALAISVGVPAAPRPTEGAFFFYASSDPGFQYGAQYKFMDTEFSTYQAVQESGEEDKGPAFYFGQTYDKIVLLPESAFPVPSGAPKKRDFQMPPGWNRNRQVVNHGDKPWMERHPHRGLDLRGTKHHLEFPNHDQLFSHGHTHWQLNTCGEFCYHLHSSFHI